MDTATRFGVLEKKGAWYSYKGKKVGQGRERVLSHLVDNPEFESQIHETLMKTLATA